MTDTTDTTNTAPEQAVTPRTPPPLPTKASDWVRKVKDRRIFADHVEPLHFKLVENDALSERYLRYLFAVDAGDTVEGNEMYDNALAALMIRDLAKEIEPNGSVAKAKLGTIVHALKIVLNRFDEGRATRELRMLNGPTE